MISRTGLEKAFERGFSDEFYSHRTRGNTPNNTAPLQVCLPIGSMNFQLVSPI
jgi:hypothetical protein